MWPSQHADNKYPQESELLPISVCCSREALIHNSFLVNSSLYVSSPPRASLVLLPVQYSTVRCFYDTILLAGSMLYFHSPPLRVHINAILYRLGRSDSQSYPRAESKLFSSTRRYGHGKPDQTSNVAIYAHASESSTIMMFTRSCHPQLGCVDDLNLACVKHLNSFQATIRALTCWGG